MTSVAFQDPVAIVGLAIATKQTELGNYTSADLGIQWFFLLLQFGKEKGEVQTYPCQLI